MARMRITDRMREHFCAGFTTGIQRRVRREKIECAEKDSEGIHKKARIADGAEWTPIKKERR
jgi:hypothetical protein